MNKSISLEWESIHSSRGWGHYPSEPVIRFVARNYYSNDRSKIRILDFGCGQGANTWYLSREGFDTYAFDGSASAVKKAETYLKSENLSAHFNTSDGINTDYPDCFFDAVIDNYCIGHNTLDAIKSMYNNIYKMLKPCGKMFTSFFTIETTGYGTGTLIETDTYDHVTVGALQDYGVIHFWKQNDMHDTLKNIGFSDISINELKYTDSGNLMASYITIAEKPGK